MFYRIYRRKVAGDNTAFEDAPDIALLSNELKPMFVLNVV